MKRIIMLLLAVMLVGCSYNKTPEVQDPCAKASQLCWGQAGTDPKDVPQCGQVVSCYNWELKAQK